MAGDAWSDFVQAHGQDVAPLDILTFGLRVTPEQAKLLVECYLDGETGCVSCQNVVWYWLWPLIQKLGHTIGLPDVHPERDDDDLFDPHEDD